MAGKSSTKQHEKRDVKRRKKQAHSDVDANGDEGEGAAPEDRPESPPANGGEDGGRGCAPYEQGEKVLAFHGDFLYNAKIQEVDQDENGVWLFLIHYMGWKKSWDEWVRTDRLLKDNPGNQKRKADLEKGQHASQQQQLHSPHQLQQRHSSPPASVQQRKGAGRGAKSGPKTPTSAGGSGRSQRPRPGALSPGKSPSASADGSTRGSRRNGEAAEAGGEAGEGRLQGAALGADSTPLKGTDRGTAPEGEEAVQQGGQVPHEPDARGDPQQQGKGRLEDGHREKREEGHKGAAKSAVPAPPPHMELHVPIPLPLKKQLVDDEDMIVRKGELLRLPARVTVKRVLEMFLEEHRQERAGDEEGVREVIQGLRDYFDRALPLMLLYRQERQQYMDLFPTSFLLPNNHQHQQQQQQQQQDERRPPQREQRDGAGERQQAEEVAKPEEGKEEKPGQGTPASIRPAFQKEKKPGAAAEQQAKGVQQGQKQAHGNTPAEGEERGGCPLEPACGAPELLPSDVYGAEHLLRLFTKLPSMMAYIGMEEETRDELQTHLGLFLRFMVKHQAELFAMAVRYSKPGHEEAAGAALHGSKRGAGGSAALYSPKAAESSKGDR